MTCVYLLAVVLATWQIVEIWHHGGLFAGIRARLELCTGLIPNLFLCPFCLTTWVAAVSILAWYMAVYLDWEWLHLPALVFATARLANLLNDVTHHVCRTPNRDNT